MGRLGNFKLSANTRSPFVRSGASSLIMSAHLPSALREGCVSSLESTLEGRSFILWFGAADHSRLLLLPSDCDERHWACTCHTCLSANIGLPRIFDVESVQTAVGDAS